MKAWGIVAVALLLGACGSKAATDSTSAPVTTAHPDTVPDASTPERSSVDAKLPGFDTPAPAWRLAAPVAGQAALMALTAALGGPPVIAGDPAQSWTYASTSAAGSKAAAVDVRAVAERVWQAAGLDLSTLDVSVSPDGRTATAVPRVDGLASPLPGFVVVVGADGSVESAIGHLATPAPAGQQDRIGTAAALGLLTSPPASVGPAEQPEPSAGPPPAVTPLNPQPTTEPPPEASAVDRILLPVTGVGETYVAVPAAGGGTWLLPGYRFTFDDGSSQEVLAVAGPPVVDGASPPTTACGAAPDCGISEFVGMPEDQAAARAATEGWVYRIAIRDGVDQMLTADYSPDRVNVAITNGTVARAWFG